MVAAMRGVSAESLDALVEEMGAPTSRSPGGALAAASDGTRVADDLFSVAAVLADEPRLRRVLTDVSRDAASKAGLVRELFAGKVGDTALALLSKAASSRWAATRDLRDALEHLGVVAAVTAAEQAGEADRVEDELFAFGQLVTGSPGLRDALSDPARSVQDKRGLLHGLLEGKVSPATLKLAEQTVSGFHRTVSNAIEEYQRIAAAHRLRLVATVYAARPLGDRDRERLGRALAAQYDRPVHLNVVVEPDVLGGLRVEIGDDVIDGTVASRLHDARRRLAG